MMPVSEYSKDTDRTTDVQTQDQTTFHTFVENHPLVLKGLTNCGYINASPIQVAACPVIIAGNDTIVEAKNGTGKTLTFVIPTLMRLKVEQSHLQSIVLAPTREIAVQIQQCFKKVGQFMPELKCEYFIGGTPVEIDKQKANGCQIAVGSPGRIKHLLNEHVLKGSEVKSFILDEVDRLFTDKNFTKDVRLIDAKLPKLKQVIVVSASIDKNDMSLFDEFLKEYTIVKGAEEDMNQSQDPTKFLLGIKQYVACVKAVSTNIILLPAKNVRLLNILQNLPYTQCIIFTNYMTRVEAVCNMLRDHNYKADYIRGDQDQNIRLKLVDRLTSFKSKILVATDLIARGIDSSNVDLVINMDCPNDWATYLHRIGRAGRFGNKGNAFTILDDDKELKSFKRIINSIENVKIKILPIAIIKPILEYDDTELEDLNLTIESDDLIKPQNESNVIEENKAPNSSLLKSSAPELNISNLIVKSEQQNEKKSVDDHIKLEDLNLKMEPDVLTTPDNENNVIEKNIKENKASISDGTDLKFSDPDSNINSSIVKSEQQNKTKSVYSFIKPEDFNYTIELDALATPYIEKNNSIEKNSKENKTPNGTELKSNDLESNISSPTVISKQDLDCSIEKLSRAVKEKEKHLIDNNLIDQKHLTADRSFVLFDPEPLLNDTDQYMKYSPQELIDIITNYDSDFEKYEAFKSASQKCLPSEDMKKDISNSNQINGQCQNSPTNFCEEKQNVIEINSQESSFLNETNDVIANKIDTNTGQRPRFSSIYDLFQIPDFSLLKPVQINKNDNTNAHSSNENSVVSEDSDVSTHKKDSIQEEYYDDEELFSDDPEDFNSEEESSNVDDEEELFSLEEEGEEEEEEENKSFDEDIESESSNYSEDNHETFSIKSNDRSFQKYVCNNIKEDCATSQKATNPTNINGHLVDYDSLNDWYREWKQQMSYIQTCVRMSK